MLTRTRVQVTGGASAGTLGYRSDTAWKAPSDTQWFAVLLDGQVIPQFIRAADLRDLPVLVSDPGEMERIRNFLDARIAAHQEAARRGEPGAATRAQAVQEIRDGALWELPS